ncbi:MAG: zinc-binding dehydrogenase [Pseudomonadota bacterium]
MQSVLMRDRQLYIEEVEVPEPGPGQVLVKSLACGICGSDLHMTLHGNDFVELMKREGMLDASADASALQLRLGHEFCAEIVRYGPETARELTVGSRVTSIPFLHSGDETQGIGTEPGTFGAYSQYFLLSERNMLEIAPDLPSEAAALTEPLAVGLHAVNVAALTPDAAVMVVGCGPIGLACISALKRRGVNTILATDLQQAKRKVAMQFGASYTLDPSQQDECEYLSRIAESRPVVLFECVGSPRMIPNLIRRAPEHATIVFIGIHSCDISISPFYATMKQLNLKFSYYYTPEEFQESLMSLAANAMPWQSMITGRVGIDGISEAFDALQQTGEHCKIIIEPWRVGTLLATRTP